MEKRAKTIEDQGEKQENAIENRVKEQFLDTDYKSIDSLFSKDSLNEEAKYELNKTLEIENKNNRVNLIFEASNKKKDKTTGSFRREIYNDNLSLDDALEQQIRLKDDIDFSKNL